jgi:hypothetical protein
MWFGMTLEKGKLENNFLLQARHKFDKMQNISKVLISVERG